ncbi:hypothetical protein LSH36_1053g01026 [Paralvinella palmiformis]|uniref:Uncharacterized protein n=1 Tax=Paralvinella palmiformis TaxID=53620 RepID=A0AAD9IVL6_9ANNE|nr:hypothetical protein LSH36_1053g01026 [Paralvinella palmiformis]
MTENSTTELSNVDVGEYLTPITERKHRIVDVDDKPPDYLEISDDHVDAEIYSYINDDYLTPRELVPISGHQKSAPPAYEQLQPVHDPDQPNNQSANSASHHVIQIQPDSLPQLLVTSPDGTKTFQPGSEGLLLQVPGEGNTTIIVNQAAAPNEVKNSLMGYIAFSCFVFWCCNCPLGATAFFVIVAAFGGSAERRDKLARISVILNVVGIIISVIVIAATVGSVFYQINNRKSRYPS